MALTVSRIPNATAARRWVFSVTVGAAGDYSSGITIDSSVTGMTVAGVNVLGSSIAAVWQFDPSSRKLRAYLQGAGAGPLTEASGAQAAGAVLLLELIEGV